MGKSRRTQTRKTSSGCAVKLKPGSVLCDTAKKEWLLGKPIGAGGFGDIYLVSQDLTRPVTSDAPFVAKVELISNGPLFVEMNFYLRVGKKEMIDKWKIEHNQEHLGMPYYIAFGSHPYHDDRYRFLILKRYGPDIGSIFLKHGRRFSLKTVLTLGLQILDTLEYIHYHGYIHADIKGSNLLLGLGKGRENKVYLLDYGLACLYVDRFGRHKEYIQDLRRAHDGTLEYTSRDAHVGAHSRRGDLEVLSYNLLQWLCGELPWESVLHDPDRVAAAKNLYMGNTSLFMEKCFPRGGAPVVIHQFVKYVAGLAFTAKPDYDRLRSMLRQGMRVAGLLDDGQLNLGAPASKITAKKRGRGSDTENRREARSPARIIGRSARKPCEPVQLRERRTRQRSRLGRTATLRSQNFDWIKILQSHPERDAKPLANLKKPRRPPRHLVEDVDDRLLKAPENPRSNPTPAMLEILGKRRSLSRTQAARRGARSDSHHRRTPSPCDSSHLTPAMEEVLRRKTCGGTGNYLPTMTAMSARAKRMSSREPRVPNESSRPIQPSLENDDAPIAARTRNRSRCHLELSPDVRRPTSRQTTAVHSSSPKAMKPSEIPRSLVPQFGSGLLGPAIGESDVDCNRIPLVWPDTLPSAFQPVISRLTRQQLRCDPSQREPISGLPWRPPTPPRKMRTQSTPYKRLPPISVTVKKRRMSSDHDSVYFPISPFTPATRSTRLTKSGGRRPSQPKYRQKVLCNSPKRASRREVSPSEVDFVPRLRSGRDTLDEYVIAETQAIRQPRPASTPPFGLRCFAAGKIFPSSVRYRSYFNLDAL